MVKKTAKRMKHVPQRTCVGCRQTLAKRSLIRVVRTAEGVRVDPTGKAAGRGSYLHDRKSCWERGLKGALAHALKIELTHQDRELLLSFMQDLPDDGDEAVEAGSGEAAARAAASPTQQDGEAVEREGTAADTSGKRTMNR